jgi:hypothetical protein
MVYQSVYSWVKKVSHKPKRKRVEEDEVPALSLSSYETRVGLDPDYAICS